jgi:serine/threonine-protein kinase
MGVVYRAEDESLRRTVALKLLRDTAGDTETRQRFLREARSAAAIVHPSVAMVFQVGEADGRQFIAMELVEGESLRARMARGPLDVATARDLATQMARGLAAAHEKGIVHRDLKPENVMITPAGVVKLLDFGLAKQGTAHVVSGPAQVAVAKTETLVTSDAQRVMGTAEYMSPEQALGRPVDVRSDVFSFGVVLYEMLAGVRPFHGLTTGELLVAIVHNPAPPLRERVTGVDEATDAVITRCLAKAPAQRFANAGEIVAALTGATTATTARGAMERRWAMAGVVVGLLLLLAAAGAIGTTAMKRPTAPVASVSAAPRATAITDFPLLPTKIPEAASEYAQATQAWRDASVELGNKHLLRAVQLDPSFALGHLMVAVWDVGAVEERRKHVATAVALRGELGERDAAILDAMRATLGRDKPDFEDDMRRWKALADRYPLDAFVIATTGIKCLVAGQKEAGFRLLDRALALDPRFAWPLAWRSSFQRDDGNLDGALASADRCLALSPSATTCLRARSNVQQLLGTCDPLEDNARKMIALEPDSAAAYEYLVTALVMRGAPVESIAEALRRGREHATTPSDRAYHEAWDPVLLAILAGDFASAAAALPAFEAWASGQTSASSVGEWAGAAIVVLEELERTRDAADVAEAYLKRLPVLTPDASDVARSRALLALHVAGRISESDFRADRESWAREEAAKLPPRDANLVWLGFYGVTSVTAADAREALEALPRYSPLPPFDGNAHLERHMGHVLLLAGRVEEAIPHLRRAVRTCWGSNYLFSHHVAAETLGEALEQKGDKPGACEAYAEVLKHWGHAKPRSVTADKARARSKALGCAPFDEKR